MVLSRLKLYALVAVAFVLGFLGLRSMWIKEGIDRERVKRQEQRLKSIEKAKEVKNEVELLDDEGLAARASEWMRKK